MHGIFSTPLYLSGLTFFNHIISRPSIVAFLDIFGTSNIISECELLINSENRLWKGTVQMSVIKYSSLMLASCAPGW